MTGAPNSSKHHKSPPTTQEDDLFNRLRLLRSRRIGIATYYRLLREHGSARAVLDALPDIAARAGDCSYTVCPEGVIAAELRAGRAAGAQLILRGDPDYPTSLMDLPDAPPMMWALGNLDLLQRPMIAIVGARNASSLGVRMARRLALDLGAAGYVVVSGLARGIDAAAHATTLQTGTIAVQAGGVDVIYPSENTELAHDIAKSGLRVTEQPVGLQPQARHFPTRNRIIAGLAKAVIIVEAAAKSGSLITAEAALSIGRDVFAVPGHPFDARSSGCNFLIRDGATLIRSASDVIEALPDILGPTVVPNIPVQQTALRGLREMAALHQQILDRLGPSPLAEDQLIRDLAAPAGQVGPALVDLELEGRIRRQSGGLLARAD